MSLSPQPRTTKHLVTASFRDFPPSTLWAMLGLARRRIGVILMGPTDTVASLVIKSGQVLQVVDFRTGARGLDAIDAILDAPGESFKLFDVTQPVEAEGPLGPLHELVRRVEPTEILLSPTLEPPTPEAPPELVEAVDETPMLDDAPPTEVMTSIVPREVLRTRLDTHTMASVLWMVSLSSKHFEIVGHQGGSLMGSIRCRAGVLVTRPSESRDVAMRNLAALLRPQTPSDPPIDVVVTWMLGQAVGDPVGVLTELVASLMEPPAAPEPPPSVGLHESSLGALSAPSHPREINSQPPPFRSGSGVRDNPLATDLITNDLSLQRQRMDRLVVEVRTLELQLEELRQRVERMRAPQLWLGVAVIVQLVAMTAVVAGLVAVVVRLF